MTNEEIRIKVAEAMGFQAEKWESGGWMLYRENQRLHHPLDGTGSRESCFYQHAPNYPLDLNACSEFEAMLTSAERFTYLVELNKLCGDEPSAVWATARHRCLAYLKTKGGPVT